VAYVRFHGRNKDRWYDHKEAYERYDYLYSEAELREWVPKIRRLAEEADRVFIFYNNHFKAQAVENAMQMKEMLEE
jgi:uncharacterized protein YecE (DUF72 family)